MYLYDMTECLILYHIKSRFILDILYSSSNRDFMHESSILILSVIGFIFCYTPQQIIIYRYFNIAYDCSEGIYIIFSIILVFISAPVFLCHS